MKRTLEVCAFGIQSCLIAAKVGAVRVELCDNPIEGGTTPSYGAIKKARAAIDIALYPILRPRSMNYCYDEAEWEMLYMDLRICKELECDGISVGVQQVDGTLDVDKMKQIVEWAYPMKVTCNRVFDHVPDPYATLEQLIKAGCERVLTSGLAATAPEGADMLKKLVTQADGRISIMPGAGVRSTNIAELAKATGAYEFHTSARTTAANPVTFFNPKVTDSGSQYIANEEELEKIIHVLDEIVY